MDDMIFYAQTKKGPVPVYYASAACTSDRNTIKLALTKRLLNKLDCVLHGGNESPSQLLSYDALGCPRLKTKSPSPLALSFTSDGQRIWAALAEAEALGIDAENRRNFVPPYPYNRVFSEDDFLAVSKFCTTKEDSAAMIWVCKEAVVKRRGTGFHGIDPRDIHILSCRQCSPFIYQAVVSAPDRKEVLITKKRDVWFALSVSK